MQSQSHFGYNFVFNFLEKLKPSGRVLSSRLSTQVMDNPFKPTDKDEYEFGKYFSIDKEVLKECIPCSWKGSVGSTPGKAYLTTNYICFVSKSRHKKTKAIPFRETLDWTFTSGKGVQIVMRNGKKYLMGFPDEEKAFKAIQRVVYGPLGNTMLHQAVVQGDKERVESIINRDPYKLAEKNKEGESPLQLAVTRKDLDMVCLLLDYYRKHRDKVDINWRDCRGFTVLHSAVIVKDQVDEILFKLMDFEGIDCNLKNQDNNTPLHYFCEYSTSLNCRLIGQELIKRGASVTAQNNNGETPLHKAIFNQKVRLFLVEMLLSKNASPNAPNNDGDTPLHYAIRLHREDLVETLVKAGANVLIKNKKNMTPIDVAEEYSRSDPNPAFLNIKKLLKNVMDLLEFLTSVEMEEYFHDFVKQGFYVPELLCTIDETTLESMGISKLPMGKQIKFFKELEQLKQKLENPKKGHSGSKELKADVMAHSTDGTSANVRQRLEFVGDGEINSDEVEYTKELGTGSSGKVYKALWRGKEVAVKVLSNVNLEAQIEEFKKEFRIMNEVKSPYMIQFYGVSLKPLSMIMEYCSRGSLYHVLNDRSLDIGWERALGFALDMARGINTLHTWKTPIVHRDLKSLNLLVNSEWQVKVADFGLSRFTTGTNLETFKKLCGTFAYCAPEIFGGFSFTTKSDVYSMGIVLWELITRVMRGRYEQPFSEYKQLHYDFQILVQAASGLRPTLPEATPKPLVDLYKACTDAKPELRPSAAEVVERLQDILNEYRANPSAWDEVIPLEARKKNLGLIQSKEISPRHQQQSSALTNTANTSNTSNKKPTSD